VVVLPAGTRPHLNDVSPGVKAAVMAVRGGGGGAAVGATTAATVGSVVVVSLTLRLSQVVIIAHWRWWRDTPRGGAAHRRRGVARQGGSTAEGGWVGGNRPLGFGSSRSGKKKNLSSDYHVEERCATEY
jgi:hypothetical protein